MNLFSSESFSGYTNLENQSNQATTITDNLGEHQDCMAMKTSHFASIHGSSSETFTISFGNVNSSPQNNLHPSKNQRQAQEHVFAERKRREKLSQRFMSLYALLPKHKKVINLVIIFVVYISYISPYEPYNLTHMSLILIVLNKMSNVYV